MSDTTPADFRPRPEAVASHEFATALDAAKQVHDAGQPGYRPTPGRTDVETKALELEQAIETGADPARIAHLRLEHGFALEQQKAAEKREAQAEAARDLLNQEGQQA